MSEELHTRARQEKGLARYSCRAGRQAGVVDGQVKTQEVSQGSAILYYLRRESLFCWFARPEQRTDATARKRQTQRSHSLRKGTKGTLEHCENASKPIIAGRPHEKQGFAIAAGLSLDGVPSAFWKVMSNIIYCNALPPACFSHVCIFHLR